MLLSIYKSADDTKDNVNKTRFSIFVYCRHEGRGGGEEGEEKEEVGGRGREEREKRIREGEGMKREKGDKLLIFLSSSFIYLQSIIYHPLNFRQLIILFHKDMFLFNHLLSNTSCCLII